MGHLFCIYRRVHPFVNLMVIGARLELHGMTGGDGLDGLAGASSDAVLLERGDGHDLDGDVVVAVSVSQRSRLSRMQVLLRDELSGSQERHRSGSARF